MGRDTSLRDRAMRMAKMDPAAAAQLARTILDRSLAANESDPPRPFFW